MSKTKSATVTPLGDRVLVKRVEADEKTKGGIIIPDTAKEKSQRGKVVAVGAGKVFVSSGYRSMSALDANTGAVVWTQQVDAPIHGAPTVSGNRVFVVDVDSQLFAFDVNTGAQAWAYRGIAEPARIMRASSPAVSGDTVIAPFSSGELVAVRAANGQAVWQQVLSRTSRTSASSEAVTGSISSTAPPGSTPERALRLSWIVAGSAKRP